MQRIGLFEFGDLKWMPSMYHTVETDFLRYYYTLFNLYEPIYEKIAFVLKQSGQHHIIDLCSGGGGPVVKLREYLDDNHLASSIITLTDIQPNLPAFAELEQQYPHKIVGNATSIDATTLPSELIGMRTFFTSFHHFPTETTAKKLLQDAVDNGMPIGIFELSERSFPSIIYAFLSSLALPILLLPQLRPFTWGKLFFIYVIPLIPLMMAWDYLISCLRTYSLKELETLIAQLHAPDYHWEVGKKAGWGGLYHVTYLIGYRKILPRKS
jgi:hypothetical protein